MKTKLNYEYMICSIHRKTKAIANDDKQRQQQIHGIQASERWSIHEIEFVFNV